MSTVSLTPKTFYSILKQSLASDILDSAPQIITLNSNSTNYLLEKINNQKLIRNIKINNEDEREMDEEEIERYEKYLEEEAREILREEKLNELQHKKDRSPTFFKQSSSNTINLDEEDEEETCEKQIEIDDEILEAKTSPSSPNENSPENDGCLEPDKEDLEEIIDIEIVESKTGSHYKVNNTPETKEKYLDISIFLSQTPIKNIRVND